MLIDAMLDLEFFGTEEDMISVYPGEDAFPIVTSIGLAIQINGELVDSYNFPVNMTQQLEAGAKFGKNCMLEFWTKQPLFGEEFARSMGCTRSINSTLVSITDILNYIKVDYPSAKLKVWGNSLLADNNKLIRLYSKYTEKGQTIPLTYFDHADYRELKATATQYTNFSMSKSMSNLQKALEKGVYLDFGFTEMKEHNAEFDCIKQLFILNEMRKSLEEAKLGLRYLPC